MVACQHTMNFDRFPSFPRLDMTFHMFCIAHHCPMVGQTGSTTPYNVVLFIEHKRQICCLVNSRRTATEIIHLKLAFLTTLSCAVLLFFVYLIHYPLEGGVMYHFIFTYRLSLT
jgi:hypothetical protein